MFHKIISHLRFSGKDSIIRFFARPVRAIIRYSKSFIFVDTSEHICWNLYWNGGYEKEVTWVLDKLTNKDSVCLDVGANIGVYTILLAEKFKKVIAFEPHPNFAERLRFNISLNGFKNVEINELALSNKRGHDILFSPPKEMSNKSATLFGFTNKELTEKIPIEKNTLDNLNIGKIDFIKIDTDGSDPDVIMGGRKTLSKYKPVILFEYVCSFPEIKEKYEKCFIFLRNLGYRISEVKDGYLSDEITKSKDFANLIAIPQ